MKLVNMMLLSAGVVSAGMAMADTAPPQLGEASVKDVVGAMTLKEKAQLVVGTGMDFPGLPEDMQGPVVGKIAGRVAGAAGTTMAIPRLGIPAIILADGPAGIRIEPTRPNDPKTYYATAYPVGSLLAATWNPELVEQVGSAMGSEVKEYGVDVLLAPALNTQRIPLGGRNFEYYSEDPLVSGKIAAAMVRGIQSNGVGTSIKHFAANNHEWNRNTINAVIDERALREIYLRGFEIVVKEAKPWTVMSSYNKINGTYTSETPRLLTDILRNQWGYDGIVMTDWFGGKNAIAQMQAGNDLLMPGTKIQLESLIKAVESGELKMSVLDRNVENILKFALKTPTFKKYHNSDKPDLVSNAKTARFAATEGMVLLQNNAQALPLKPAAKLAILGNASYDMVTGGTGSGDVNKAYSISLLQGLTDAGFGASNSTAQGYADYIKAEKIKLPVTPFFLAPPPIPERLLPAAELQQLASQNDIAIITIGRKAGEFVDRKVDNDFKLTANEQSLVQDVAKAFHAKHKKVVVILNVGGAVELVSWRDQVDAILLAWQPGQEAGHAIADVLSGKVNPSGKLPSTFAIAVSDFPSADGFPGVVTEAGDPNDHSLFAGAKAAEVVYKEGIWVGYRYFNTKKVKPAYPFGYGLSYTQFSYSNLVLSSDSFTGKLTATVTVTNSGKLAGKEVAQLYIAAPKGSLEKPEAELRAFVKTKVLAPKESQTLSFDVNGRDLASFDTATNAWVADEGKYTLEVGSSSTDIRQSKVFTLEKPLHIAL